MDHSPGSPRVARFDVFEVGLRAGELCKPGSKMRLQDKPLQILTLLLEHPGEVVTREELQKRLWPDGIIVDFEHSINAAVNRLRAARIGSLGYPFPGMGDFAVDTTHVAATLGCAWTNLTVEDYINRSAAAPAAEVGELVAEYRQSYEVAPDLTEAARE